MTMIIWWLWQEVCSTCSPSESLSHPRSTWASQNSQAEKIIPGQTSSKVDQDWIRGGLPATSWSCTAPPSPPPHCSPGPSNETLMVKMITMTQIMMIIMMSTTTVCVVCWVERVMPILSRCNQVLEKVNSTGSSSRRKPESMARKLQQRAALGQARIVLRCLQKSIQVSFSMEGLLIYQLLGHSQGCRRHPGFNLLIKNDNILSFQALLDKWSQFESVVHSTLTWLMRFVKYLARLTRILDKAGHRPMIRILGYHGQNIWLS